MTSGRLASRIIWICLSALVLASVTAWAALALWFRFPGPEWAKAAAAGIFVILALGALLALLTRSRWVALLVFALAFGGVVIWWGSIEPPADGDWTPDVARQTTGTLAGDILTLSDVRDFDWRSDNDFSERWSKHSYDLSKLKTLDLFLLYWAGPQMAHLIMSFGFDGGEKLAWSVEIRREKNSEYSPVADALKSHALVYLATTERDSVRLRSNVRGEDVRLYRLRASPEATRILLLQYASEANALAEKPAFYNSLTTNCTTSVAKLIRAAGVTTIPLSELMALARIDKHARAADQSPEFSGLIRVDVPSPHAQTEQ